MNPPTPAADQAWIRGCVEVWSSISGAESCLPGLAVASDYVEPFQSYAFRLWGKRNPQGRIFLPVRCAWACGKLDYSERLLALPENSVGWSRSRCAGNSDKKDGMNCRLCGADRPLRKSHILPEFFYKPIYDSSHRINLQCRKCRLRI